MSYSEEYICKRLLDNADLSIAFDPHRNKIALNFLVFGNVDGRYFSVSLYCNSIFVFRINYQEAEVSSEVLTQCFLALECTVKRKPLRETSWIDDFASTGNNLSADTIVSEISVIGEVILKIVCQSHTFEVQEISEREYEERYSEEKRS